MQQPRSFENLVNPPEFPLPWRPSMRAEIKRKLFLDNVHKTQDITTYIQDIDSHYVITDIGVNAVRLAIGYTAIGADVFYKHEATNTPQAEVQRTFENDMLGLAPLPHGDGLRFREHPAGFGGGTYPIEAFAGLVNTDTDTFRALLDDKEATRFGHVIIKSANYITPVKKFPNQPSLVRADNTTELSPEGLAMLNIALSIADYSSRIDDGTK